MHISDTNLKLRDIWEGGAWCFEKLMSSIPSNIKDEMLNVPVPMNPASEISDCWIWNDNKEGCYFAASGYKWLLALNYQTSLVVLVMPSLSYSNK